MACYRPFLDGSWRLAMGLKALDLDDWIEIDASFAAQLAARRALIKQRRDVVCLALREGRIGQAEVLALLLDHLPARFPEIYRRGPVATENLVTGHRRSPGMSERGAGGAAPRQTSQSSRRRKPPSAWVHQGPSAGGKGPG